MLRTGDLISKIQICSSLVDRTASVGGSRFWTIGVSLLYRSLFQHWWSEHAEEKGISHLLLACCQLERGESWNLSSIFDQSMETEGLRYDIVMYSADIWANLQEHVLKFRQWCKKGVDGGCHLRETALKLPLRKVQMEGMLLRSCFHSICQERLGKESTEKKGFSGRLGDWWGTACPQLDMV